MSTDGPPSKLRSLKPAAALAQLFPVQQVHERAAWSVSGTPLVVIGLAALLTGAGLAIRSFQGQSGAFGAPGVASAGLSAALLLVGALALRGLASVAPGQTLVLEAF